MKFLWGRSVHIRILCWGCFYVFHTWRRMNTIIKVFIWLCIVNQWLWKSIMKIGHLTCVSWAIKLKGKRSIFIKTWLSNSSFLNWERIIKWVFGCHHNRRISGSFITWVCLFSWNGFFIRSQEMRMKFLSRNRWAQHRFDELFLLVSCLWWVSERCWEYFLSQNLIDSLFKILITSDLRFFSIKLNQINNELK